MATVVYQIIATAPDGYRAWGDGKVYRDRQAAEQQARTMQFGCWSYTVIPLSVMDTPPPSAER